MNQLLHYGYALFFFVCSLLLFMVGFTKHQSFTQDSSKKHIVCSTTFIADAVRQIAQDHVTIDCLMGPGVDPHLYRARESDIHKLAAADLIIYNGLHLEGKMSDVLANMQMFFNKTVVVASDGVAPEQLIIVTEHIYDPHIWHNVQLWKQCVLHISKALTQIDPEHTTLFNQNTHVYVQELDNLTLYIKKQIERLPTEKRILVTAHDAFSYFGKAYGVMVVGLQGISTEAQVGTKDIQNLADYIVLHSIRALFVESSITERTLLAVQQAVNARGFNVEWGEQLYSDALGLQDSTAATYVGMMKHNVDALVKALL